MITFCMTYDTVTAETAEAGDSAESGFYEHGGWTFPIESSGLKYERPQWKKPGDLRDFLKHCRDMGMHYDGCTSWLYSYPEPDYASGAETVYAAHIDGCTPSTKHRILRLFA